MARLTKVCPGCGRNIPAENFRGETCAACAVKPAIMKAASVSVTTKVCFRCGRKLPREAFSINSGHSDGLSSNCRECDREKRRLAKERNARAEAVSPVQEERPATRKCARCGRDLPLDAFPVRPELRSGYDSRCRECFNAACRASKEAKKKAEEYQAEKAAHRFAVPAVPLKVDAASLPELAACPFCGGVPKFKRIIVGSMVSWDIVCECTSDPSHYVSFNFETPDEAAVFWNRRPEESV